MWWIHALFSDNLKSDNTESYIKAQSHLFLFPLLYHLCMQNAPTLIQESKPFWQKNLHLTYAVLCSTSFAADF